MLQYSCFGGQVCVNFFMKYWNVHPYGLASLRMTEWNDGMLKMINGNTMVIQWSINRTKKKNKNLNY